MRKNSDISAPGSGGKRFFFPVEGYDLASTLDSGQAFRWEQKAGGWEAVIHGRWVRLRQQKDGIEAETSAKQADWAWLGDYLQISIDLPSVIATFPKDPVMREAVASCKGLRLLRQEPWECVASFICSSSKQIAQIKGIISLICEKFGEKVRASPDSGPAFAFPGPERLAGISVDDLSCCKAGFRTPYLIAAAKETASGRIDLPGLASMPYPEAKARLMELPGVGPKIADCVLLFSCGKNEAFPVDVWIARVLDRLYFQGRKPSAAELRGFISGHFGPNAGFAQQYLFHYSRTRAAELFGDNTGTAAAK